MTLSLLYHQDIILHVNDASHPDRRAQMEHVEGTIRGLIQDQPIINVANKIDLVKEEEPALNMLGVSAKQLTGEYSPLSLSLVWYIELLINCYTIV